MAVKTKKIFGIFFTLTNHKLIFVNCRSVTLKSGPCSFLLQPILTWLAVLSANFWSFDFNATIFQKKFSKFLDVFVLLVPFETLSHYLNIDSSHWLTKEVQWIIKKVFREKRIV